MITYEQAKELVGDWVLDDPEFLELLEGILGRNGKAWVIAHQNLLLALWEYIESM